MKTGDALKLAGIAFAGVAAYLVVTRTVKAGGKVVEGVKAVITQDLNPASDKNIVYKNLPLTAREKVGDFLGSIFDPTGYAKYRANLDAIKGMNTGAATQKTTATPEQIEAEKTILRRMERSYTDPFEGVKTQDPYAAPEGYPINF